MPCVTVSIIFQNILIWGFLLWLGCGGDDVKYDSFAIFVRNLWRVVNRGFVSMSAKLLEVEICRILMVF